LCGNLTTDRAIALIEANFQDWQAPDTPLPLPPVVTLPSEPQSAITPQDTQQSILMLGHGAPAIGEQADYLRLKLLNTYLGNGLSSRLFVELREKRGLAYDVSAFYPTRCERSQFVTYIGTAPENTAIAHQGLQEELTRLCDAPLSEVEVQTAKNKLLGQYALGKQTNAEISQLLGWYEILGLGIDFDRAFPEQINQITPQELQHAAQQYLGSSPYLSVVGPAAAVQSLAT
jgi:predicted Zn-dependent peptidase